MENDIKTLLYLATGGLLVYIYMKSKEKNTTTIEEIVQQPQSTWQNTNPYYYLYPYPYVYGGQSQPIVVNTSSAAAASSSGNATATSESGKPSAPALAPAPAPAPAPEPAPVASFAGTTSSFYKSEKQPPYSFDGIINKSTWH